MTWFRRRRHGGQDTLVEQARAQAESARQDAELSRRRAESVRRHVNEPRRKAAERNQFASIIRATLQERLPGGDREPGPVDPAAVQDRPVRRRGGNGWVRRGVLAADPRRHVAQSDRPDDRGQGHSPGPVPAPVDHVAVLPFQPPHIARGRVDRRGPVRADRPGNVLEDHSLGPHTSREAE